MAPGKREVYVKFICDYGGPTSSILRAHFDYAVARAGPDIAVSVESFNGPSADFDARTGTKIPLEQVSDLDVLKDVWGYDFLEFAHDSHRRSVLSAQYFEVMSLLQNTDGRAELARRLWSPLPGEVDFWRHRLLTAPLTHRPQKALDTFLRSLHTG